MINHSITTRGVKRGSSMVEEDDDAEGASLKPSSSSAAIEKSEQSVRPRRRMRSLESVLSPTP